MSGGDAARTAICLAGPTGTGKSAAALHVAEVFGGVIINADSRQVYRDFPLITAQPGREELARCPHALYGFLDTGERISAGRWAALAGEAARAAMEAGSLPILTGGTGLYLRALLDGVADIPPVPESIRSTLLRACEACGPAVMHERLRNADPACAARLHPNDRQRILRALEVYESTGKPLSWWQAERAGPGAPWRVLRLALGLPLSELTPILASRIDRMLEAGAAAEAEAALSRCPDGTAPGWSGIGCAELRAYLEGKLDMDAMRRRWLTNTRAYAKRQLTWFRADARLCWFRPAEHEAVENAVMEFLGSGPA
ncbi:MAG: tRNA (adenosine(37)-N6)-dimethylallyltransferase MiaA [Deltaproteobacteria bacterium]|jgi:tRNA dimethylallyltransferase|nr:tRNA (adenosine(37)-N6)-dimethylallyltransferase MiaA [Deltaproteobacteria bacterium]